MKIGLRTVSLYLLFVGLPVLGILSSLAIGRNLSAPATVHGVWALSFPEQPALECKAFAGWQGEMQMAISQSGPDLILVLNDSTHTELTGKLSGLSITARTGSRAAIQLQLAAEVDLQGDPDRLSGSLQAAGCSQQLDFSAVLLPSQEH